ncbi:hypothetical protein ABTM71_19380, partial [Acinetobacter baumannii]
NALASSALISSPLNFQTLFQQALRNALSLPRQAVHISLPNDIAGTCVPNYHASVKPITYRPMSAASTDAKAVDTALHDLVHAKRPLIFLGN